MSNVLCITGMHRSGTSLVASWLQQCGLTIDNGEVIRPGLGNPRGHFEDKDFVDLHSTALGGRHSPSKGWKIMDPSFRSFNSHERDIAHRIVSTRESGSHDTWGWKDPRTVVFMECWRRLIPNLRVLYLWRPASDVVSSLCARSSLTRRKSIHHVGRAEALRLWSHYNRLVLEGQRRLGSNALTVPVAAILHEDRRLFELVEQTFRLDLTYIPLSTIYEPGKDFGRSNSRSARLPRSSEVPNLEQQLARLAPRMA